MINFLYWLEDKSLHHLLLTVLILGSYFIFQRTRSRKLQHRVNSDAFKKSMAVGLHEPISLHPEVDAGTCMGCGSCTRACPEGDILRLIEHRATLVDAKKCMGHGECEQACPTGAISLVFGTKTRGVELPRITTHYESSIPGLYLVGEVAGMGLIRNAVRQGSLAVEHAAKSILSSMTASSQTKKSDLRNTDILIVGGGPAGISAALKAKELGLSHIILEQGKFGGTIASFPRQKLVNTRTFEMPLIGKSQFDKPTVSKDELMKLFFFVKKKFSLQVHEKTQFQSCSGDPLRGFSVLTDQGEYHCKRVIVATGVRSNARRLDVPGEDLNKVTYSLEEPEQYKNKRIIVVGGGNVAVENALLLAAPELNNQVSLLIRSASFDTASLTNQEKAINLEKLGKLNLIYSAQVTEIKSDRVIFKKDQGHQDKVLELNNDFVFICVGSQLPIQFLTSLGISMEKKFGEKRIESNVI